MLQQSSNSAASSAGDAGSMPDAHVVAQEMLSRYALPGATTPAAELIHQHSLQVAADLARWGARLLASPVSSIVERAKALAVRAHAQQLDRAGKPYIEHVARVAAAVAGDPDAEAVAWLHDAAEDHPDIYGQIVESMPLRIVIALDLLDRNVAGDYYTRIRANPLALRVKLADLADSADESRLALLGEATANRLRRKYAEARAALTSAGGDQQPAAVMGDLRNREATLRNALEHIAGSCDGRAAEVARVALASAPAPAPEETITVQQAWEWAGGNPGIKATREELEDALRDLDAICDEAAEVAIPVDAGAVERGARAVAAVESWGGWDTNSPTPNGNTPDEQREWCRDVARAVLAAATSPASASARCTACGKPKHGDRPILMCACATLVMVPKGSAP